MKKHKERILRDFNKRGVASTHIVTTGFNQLSMQMKKHKERILRDFNKRGVASTHIVTTGFNPLTTQMKTLRAVGSIHISERSYETRGPMLIRPRQTLHQRLLGLENAHTNQSQGIAAIDIDSVPPGF